MRAPCTFVIGESIYRPGVDEDVLEITLEDVEGTYTIPAIQTETDIYISAEFHDPELERISVRFACPGRMEQETDLTLDEPEARLIFFPQGEYAFSAAGYDENDEELFTCSARGPGIGTVIAALGDSITEGYFGRGFMKKELDLKAAHFPQESVSHDGRNYPQYAPTTHRSKPDVNCFESWMTDLNNRLSESLGQPVFIANEGWGGHKTSDILAIIREDAAFDERMEVLRPNCWLIHLGVNDERAGRPTADMIADYEAIISELGKRYEAAPEDIFVALPCYDYADGAKKILQDYAKALDRMIDRLGVRKGPDFFDAYSRDKERLYGADPVHPNEEGMRFMAELWHNAITGERKR